MAKKCIIDWWLEGWQLQAEVATVGQTAEGNKIKYSQTAKWEFD